MKSKRFLSLILAIVLVAALFTGITVTASADNEIINYTVKSGDYLYKICKNNGLTYAACKEAIKLLNGFTSEVQLNRIYAGQVIKLPASDALAATVRTQVVIGTGTSGGSSSGTGSSGTSTSGDYVSYYLVPHVVVSGETLASICSSLGTNYSTYANLILTINNISSVTHLYAGKTVLIPVTAKPTSGTYYSVVSHKVTSGETMTAICNNYGMNYSTNMSLVQRLNDGYNLNSIKVGQVVLVPTTKSVQEGSSSGSGSSGTTTSGGYDISFSISGSDHGTPYATVNGSSVSKATSGSTVVINGGSGTSSIMTIEKVQRTDTKATVAFDSDSNSFTMPACGVLVVVKYSEGIAIDKTVVGKGSFETYVNNEIASRAVSGQKVFIKTTPNSGYVVSAVQVNGKTAVKDGTNSYSYAVTSADTKVSITVTFVEAKFNSISVFYDEAFTKKSSTMGSAVCKVDGTSIGTAGVAEGTVVTVAATPANGYSVSKVLYNDSSKTYNASKISSNEWSIEMPDTAISVAVVFERSEAFNLSSNIESKYGSVVFKVKDSNGNYVKSNSAKVGNDVYFYLNSASLWSVSLNSVLCANGTAVVSVDKPTSTCPYYHFVMPSSSVVVNVDKVQDNVKKANVFSYQSEAYTTYRDVSGVQVACDSFAVGESVIVKANGKIGFNAKYYHVLGAAGHETFDNITLSDGTAGKLTMDPQGVVVQVVYNTKGYTAAVNAETNNDNGTVRVLSSGAEVANSNTSTKTSNVYVGSTLTFDITPAADEHGKLYDLLKVMVLVDGVEKEDITSTYQNGYTIQEDANGKKITVKAVFDGKSYAVTCADPYVVVAKETAKEGEKVEFEVNCPAGQTLASVPTAGDCAINHVSGTKYAVTVGKADVVISVKYKYSLTTVTGAKFINSNGDKVTEALSGEKITLVPESSGTGTRLGKVEIGEAGKEKPVDIKDNKYEFTVENFPVNAKVEFKYQVTLDGSTGSIFIDDTAVSDNCAFKGQTVKIVYETVQSNVKLSTGDDITSTGTSWSGKFVYNFEMPAKEIKVTAN